MNEVYTIQISQDGRMREIPAYTCGHCTAVVVMNPRRVRERVACSNCGRWLCEKNELCNSGCAPTHSLAKDHFEASSRWKDRSVALLQGHTTVEGARKAGFDI